MNQREITGEGLRRDQPAEFRALSDERTLEFPFSSELPVERWFGSEILSHQPEAVILDRLNDGAPVLWNHDPGAVIGVVEKAWLDGEKARGMARVRFSRNPLAQQITADIADGILRNVSVGYVIREAQPGAEGQVIATRWEPLELTITSIPADPSVGIGRALTHAQHAAPVAATTPPPIPMEDSTPLDIEAVRAAAAADERARTSQILTLTREHGLEPLADDLISRGCSMADAQAQVLAELAKRAKQPATAKAPASPQAQPISGGADIGLSSREVREFRVMKLLRALTFPNERAYREEAGLELEASRAVAEHMGLGAPSGAYLPNEIITRDLTAGTASGGGDLISTDYRGNSLIGVLRNRLALEAAGVTVWADLSGPVAIPRETNDVTAYWVGEKTAATESSPTTDMVNLSPKTVRAYTEFTKQLMMQSSVDVENWVIRKLAIALQLKIDKAGLYGLGTSYQPEGIKNVTGINTEDFGAAAPTYAELVSMESKINADNADLGAFTYITNSTIHGGFKTTEKFSTTGQTILEPGGTVNGHRCLVSNQVESGDVFLGVWSQAYLALWGAVDLQVNPFSLDTTGQIRVTAGQVLDYAVAHPESFCRGNNTL